MQCESLKLLPDPSVYCYFYTRKSLSPLYVGLQEAKHFSHLHKVTVHCWPIYRSSKVLSLASKVSETLYKILASINNLESEFLAFISYFYLQTKRPKSRAFTVTSQCPLKNTLTFLYPLSLLVSEVEYHLYQHISQ